MAKNFDVMLVADCTDVCRLSVSVNDDNNLEDGNRAVVQFSFSNKVLVKNSDIQTSSKACRFLLQEGQ